MANNSYEKAICKPENNFASLRFVPFPFALGLCGAGFLFGEFFLQGAQRECVDDVGFGEAGFAGGAGVEAKAGGCGYRSSLRAGDRQAL